MNSLSELVERLHSVPDLRERSLLLSTESTGTFIKSMGSFFTSKLSSVKGFFSNDVAEYKIKTDPFIDGLLKTYKSKQSTLSNTNYMTVAKKMTPWPDSFAKNLYDTVVILKPALIELDKIFIKSINNTDTLISKAISDPDFIKSTRPYQSNTEREKVIELCYKAVDDIVNPELRRDKVQVQEAIPNISVLSDIVQVFEIIRDLDMYKDAIKADKLSKNIRKKIDDLLNTLGRTNQFEVSKMGLSLLATEIEEAAKLVSLMSTMLYIISQTADTTTSLIKTITE